MSWSGSKFVSTNVDQEYEQQDWLYRNGFSKRKSNVDELNMIIVDKVKNGNVLNVITWDELDNALNEHAEWFSSLAKFGA